MSLSDFWLKLESVLTLVARLLPKTALKLRRAFGAMLTGTAEASLLWLFDFANRATCSSNLESVPLLLG
jgi:hypothetical protein